MAGSVSSEQEHVAGGYGGAAAGGGKGAEEAFGERGCRKRQQMMAGASRRVAPWPVGAVGTGVAVPGVGQWRFMLQHHPVCRWALPCLAIAWGPKTGTAFCMLPHDRNHTPPCTAGRVSLWFGGTRAPHPPFARAVRSASSRLVSHSYRMYCATGTWRRKIDEEHVAKET